MVSTFGYARCRVLYRRFKSSRTLSQCRHFASHKSRSTSFSLHKNRVMKRVTRHRQLALLPLACSPRVSQSWQSPFASPFPRLFQCSLLIGRDVQLHAERQHPAGCKNSCATPDSLSAEVCTTCREATSSIEPAVLRGSRRKQVSNVVENSRHDCFAALDGSSDPNVERRV